MSLLFGTDGIRGCFGEGVVSEGGFVNVAHALALAFQNAGRIAVARDTRESGEILSNIVADTLRKLGRDVVDLGVVPTPALAIYTEQYHALGLMITASHNPPCDNGMKIILNGKKISSALERHVERCYEWYANTERLYGVRYTHDAEFYRQSIRARIGSFKANDIKVVLDTANGACSAFAPELFAEYGFDVDAICSDGDGKHINVNCGVLETKMLLDRMQEIGAEIGIAFDGDGDRVVFCSQYGEVSGEDVIACLASEVPQCSRIVTTRMSSMVLEMFATQSGIEVLYAEPGDRNVVEVMEKYSVPVGGESSGHFLMKGMGHVSDGILIGLYLSLRYAKHAECCFAEYISRVPKILTKKLSLKLHKSSMRPLYYKDASMNIAIRPSGTEKCWRVLVEGGDEVSFARASTIVNEFFGVDVFAA